MGDLALAYGVLALLALGLFLISGSLARRFSPRAADVAALAVVLLLFFYVRTLWYDPRLAGWLPFSSLIVLGNWLPLFAAVLAGIVWSKQFHSHWRRRALLVELTGAGLTAAIYPLL